MSDSELEIALEAAKQSADGLVAAMILLEQQDQLRRADAVALTEWQSRQQPVVSSPVVSESVGPTASNDFQPESPASVGNSLDLGTSDFEEHASAKENFDEILSASLDSATAAVDTIEADEATSSASRADDEEPDTSFAPLSASDLAVTGTLNQIVESVNKNFETSASEDLTAEEEIGTRSKDEPLPSNAIKIVTDPRGVKSRAFGALLSKLPFGEYLVAAVVPVLTLGMGASVATITLSIAIGMLLHASIAFMYRLNESRGNQSSEMLMRATYGVWGAHVPQALLVLARLSLIGVLTTWLVLALNKTTSLGDLGVGASVMPGLLNGGQLIACILALLIAITSFSRRLVFTLMAITIIAVLGVSLFALTTLPVAAFAVPDFGLSVGFGVAYAIAVGMLFRQKSAAEGSMKKLGSELLEISSTRVVPSALMATMTALAASSPTVSAVLAGSGNPVADLNRLTASGFATSINVSVALTVMALVSSQANSVQLALASFNVTGAGMRRVLVVVLLALSVIASPVFSLLPASASLVLLLGCTAGALTPYLTEALYRRSNFHEVSLLRGYAFYKRVSIAAVSGNLVFLALLAACVVPNQLLQISAPTWFGEFTALVLIVVAVKVWTLLTSFRRIKQQEAELEMVEIRRNELAGLDFIS
jgi:hypothetical protein